MTHQDSRNIRDEAVAFARRMVCGTIAAAGVVGALALSPGHAVQPVSTSTAMTQPMQPPPPPPGWPPPEMHQPGQQGPAPGDQDKPPPASPPITDPICQDILGVPDVNAPCHDPSDVA
ncbi:hypothetical protein [Pseudonocardia sediminis]|uniref:hypothetical protein n=1 Tax=Pseudonocardia sediminis TaxID=1397368 RepID=UPI0010292550|nr:hypothetical protein [Pseudonocardia sediminis]